MKLNHNKKSVKISLNLFALYAVMVCGIIFALPAFAADDPLVVVENLSTFIFSLIRAVGLILLKALAPYYYRERALRHSTQEVGKLILKINSLPVDKKATFYTEEIRFMRTTINRLRNERLSKGQYTDATDDMLLKLI